MALEKANAEGLNVKMVVVADDCALPLGKGALFDSLPAFIFIIFIIFDH